MFAPRLQVVEIRKEWEGFGLVEQAKADVRPEM